MHHFCRIGFFNPLNDWIYLYLNTNSMELMEEIEKFIFHVFLKIIFKFDFITNFK